MERALRVLGIEPGEAGPVLLLSLRAAVASLAVVLGQSYQSALFLDVLDASMLPWHFVATAAATVLLTAPYGALQRRLGEAAADGVLLGILAVGLLPGMLWPAAVREPAAMFGFTLWVQLAGLYANVGVWDAAVRVFPSRRARALLPLVSAAATLGCIVGGLGTRLVAELAGNDALLPLLLACTAGAAATGGRPRIDRLPAAPGSPRAGAGPLRAGLRLVAANRLVLYVVLVVLLAMPLFAAADFGFKKALQQRYSADGLAAFLGDYYLWVNVGVLAAQTLVMGRLMRRVGVGLVAATTPVLAAGAAVLLVAAPALGTALALSAVVGTLRFTFYQNSRNQLLTPLPAREKAAASLVLRTMVLPIGSVFGGLALLPVKDAPLPALGLVAAAGAALLLWVALAGSRAYRAELQAGLRKRVLSEAFAEQGLAQPDATALAALRAAVRYGPDEDASFAAGMLGQWGALEVAELEALAGRPRPELAAQAVALAVRLPPERRDAFLERLASAPGDPELVERACRALAAAAPDRAQALGRTLLEAAEPPRRAAGAILCAATGTAVPPEAERRLLEALGTPGLSRALALGAAAALPDSPARETLLGAALRDPTPAVRRAAIEALGITRPGALLPALEEALDDAHTRGAALEALARTGRLGEVLRRDLVQCPHPRRAPFLARAAAGRDDAEGRAVLAATLAGGRGWTRALVLRAVERRAPIPPAALDLPALERSVARELALFAVAAARTARRLTVLELDAERGLLRRAAFSLLRLQAPAQRARLAELEASLGAAEPGPRNAALELLEDHCRGGREWLPAVLDPCATAAADVAARLGLDGLQGLSAAELLRRSGDAQVAAAVAVLEQETPMPDAGLDPRLLAKAMGLRHSGFFRHLATEILLDVARRAEERSLGAGEALFEEGASPDGLYFVVAGRLEVTIRGRRINELAPGAVLGEIALLDRGPRSASVRALEAADLLRFSPELFDEIVEDYPDVARGAIALLVEHIRRQCAEPAARDGDGAPG
jgi:hypothetical protein